MKTTSAVAKEVTKLPSIFIVGLLLLPPLFLFCIGYTSMAEIKGEGDQGLWSLSATLSSLPIVLVVCATSVFAIHERSGGFIAALYLAFIAATLVLLGPERTGALAYLSLALLLLLIVARRREEGSVLSLLGLFWVLVALGGLAGYFSLLPPLNDLRLWHQSEAAFGKLAQSCGVQSHTLSALLGGLFLFALGAQMRTLFVSYSVILAAGAVVLGAALCTPFGLSGESIAGAVSSALHLFYITLAVIIVHADSERDFGLWIKTSLNSILAKNRVALAGLIMMAGTEVLTALGRLLIG